MTSINAESFPVWFLEEAINEILPGLTNNVCDVNLPADVAAAYKPGMIIREPSYTNTSGRIRGMTTSHRFSILSNHLFDYSSVSEDEHVQAWDLQVARPGSRFQVLDVYESDDKTQILLLHLPFGARWKLFDSTQINIIQDMIPACRERFDTKKDLDPIQELDDTWLNLCKKPLGLDEQGEFFPLEDSIASQFKPIKEFSFRELAGRELYVRDMRKTLKLDKLEGKGDASYPDGILFGFLDHERGLAFRYLCEARLSETGEIETSNALDDTLVSVASGAVMESLGVEVLTNTVSEYNDVLSPMHDQYKEEIKRYSNLRDIGFLDQFRSKEYPDDVQALLVTEKDSDPEIVWMRLESIDEDNTIQAKLLNEPFHDFGVNKGSMLPLVFHETDKGVVCLAFADAAEN